MVAPRLVNRSSLLSLVALLQAIAGVRVVWRLARTAHGERIMTREAPVTGERVTVILPVLNERARLGPCLDGLVAQPGEVAEMLVIDGGSRDGTQELIAAYARLDRRVRLVDAAPVPPGENGKAHGLQVGLEQAEPASAWVLTIDADVRPNPALARSLLAHACRTGAAMVSIATEQRLSGAAEGLVHPALLATLVYRFGIPGHATRRVGEVQANGQCCLVRREPLEAGGGFRVGKGSVCEDVTMARMVAANGHLVGFYEAPGLATVEMYEGWRDAWRNWTRSLPMRDQYAGFSGWLGLAEIVLAQGLPLPLALGLRWLAPTRRLVIGLNIGLLMMRIGVLAGMARAYPNRPWTYWLSPLSDLPAAVQLWRSAVRRRHAWRGRTLIRGHEGM
jgi:dolichol-phosphate mannosyltransferase